MIEKIIEREEYRNENLNRIGDFRIDFYFVANCEWDILMDIMKNFFIVRCIDEKRYFDIRAISPLFDKLEEGAKIPFYDIEVICNNKAIKVNVRKRE